MDCTERRGNNKIKYWAVFGFLLKAVIIPPDAQSQNWEMSQNHSTIQFSIKYLVVSEITGKFRDYDVVLTSSKPDFSDAKIDLKILTNSLETGNKERDADLRSKNLFYVQKYPEMIFRSKSVNLLKKGRYSIMGNLTIKDITRSVVLEAISLEEEMSDDGRKVSNWKISANVNRSDFNLKLSRLKEIFADDKVKISIEAEFILN